jgi:saccharopine dehydrogenase (NAD+, L-lysine-forming)
MMKIGLLKEGKVPSDKRVVLTPEQCKIIKATYSDIELVVQSSKIRCFSDDDYISEGIKVVRDISDCDVLLGVKEVPAKLLIPNKTYFYFSHTIKKQPYNRDLLVKMMAMKINMVDYEVLKNQKGDRLLGFGRYAGIVGAYNGFLTYGLKSGKYSLKAAHHCKDRLEVDEELKNLIFNNEKIVVTGNGRVGNGVMEIMKKSGIREVSINEFLNQTYHEAVFVKLNTMDYNERIDGSMSDKYEFYAHPELYQSSFVKFAKKADIFIAGHYYGSGSPYLFTREDAKSEDFNLKVVADISCDIDGPVASTIRPSTISKPIYGYNPLTEQEVSFDQNIAIAVMAVSNLPCELPLDASEDFGNEMLDKIIPSLMNGDKDQVISNATICSAGDLTPNFEYLREYVNGI